ncbi:hypothetical protein DEJ48_01140 [Streptomyces venezuelae]|uniref:Lipoprotein n=1 Tax=Streptomyces venezuelae TaxID=54571 RepID=A0A5P2BUW6_STRVZ|nr:hypothetical protein [Streptomyces venezuelae]QES32209.1 hypothetical protein DEJ48_01140 [Streptomyces venezuelae]
MLTRPFRALAAVAVSGAVLAAMSGCGSEDASADGAGSSSLTDRARQVAEAWDGSAAAAAWRTGYHPAGETVQPPRGGLRGAADERAFEAGRFVLRAELPGPGPKNAEVTWPDGPALTRPLMGAGESYRALARSTAAGEPRLTVTGVKRGEMRVTTSRGPAKVPAWLYTLDGYASPLKQAAVLPSDPPRPPIGRARDVPGLPLDRLVGTAADGRAVTVIALHGACDDGAFVRPLETDGSVVLLPSVKKRNDDDGLCTSQAEMQRVTVELRRPVGDRVVLDALTGRPVLYKGMRGITP